MNMKTYLYLFFVPIFVAFFIDCTSCGKQTNDIGTKDTLVVPDDSIVSLNDSIVRFIDSQKVVLRKLLVPGTWLENHVEINNKSYEALYVIMIPKETDYIPTYYDSRYGITVVSFIVESGNPSFSSVNGVLFSADTTLLIEAPKGLTKFKVPSSTKRIASNAFEFSDIEEIELPDGLETIGEQAFIGCFKLGLVKVPSTVKEIEDNAFGCYSSHLQSGEICDGNMENIEIPKDSKLEKLGRQALFFVKHVFIPKYLTQDVSSCFNSPYVEVHEENPVYCSEQGVLYNKNKDILFCVPNQRRDEFVIPTSVRTIKKFAFDTEGIDKFVLNDHIENLSSNSIPKMVGEFIIQKDDNCSSNESDYCVIDGVLFSSDTTTLIAYPALSKRKRYVVPKQVKEIDSSAFWQANISSLVLPDGLKIIREGAFGYCDSLKRIDIPASVQTIEENFCFLSDSPKKVFFHGEPQEMNSELLKTENVELIWLYEDEIDDE